MCVQSEARHSVPCRSADSGFTRTTEPGNEGKPDSLAPARGLRETLKPLPPCFRTTAPRKGVATRTSVFNACALSRHQPDSQK